MLNFRKLQLEDVEVVRAFLNKSKSRICDYTIGGLFMWRDYFDTEFVVDDGTLFFKVKYLRNETAFTVPVCGDIESGISKLKEYCKEKSLPLKFCTVSSENIELLRGYCDIKELVSERAWFDYLYLSEDLVKLSGRRYSGQRNHINKFNKLYPGYSFCEIDEGNLPAARAFIDEFFNHGEDLNDIGTEEMRKVYEVFDNYSVYKLHGGMIVVDGEIVAISVGEIVNDTLFVHIEKSNREYQGSYQVMVNEFAKHFASGLLYINREEDVGDEGLRTSKLSYHPVKLLEKSTVEVYL